MSSNKLSENETKVSMTEYWKEHSVNANLNEMMLDTNATEMSKFEMNEILSVIPSVRDCNILELGAGIGRYTAKFCSQAKKVVAVDFMESFIQKNSENNKNYKNLTLICDDVMNLSFEKDSFDTIFVNWLFMYLSDEEINLLTSRILTWLVPGGHFFVRESCNKPSGNAKRTGNPTFYRSKLQYDNLLTLSTSLENKSCRFKILWSKPIGTYIRFKNNQNQICWLLQSRSNQDQEINTFEPGMNQISFYEKIYGRNNIDSGSDVLMKKITEVINGISPTDHVLDIGCGIGGNSIALNQNFNCSVQGIDWSKVLINIATTRNSNKLEKVKFEVADVRTVDFQSSSFDVVFTKDALFHNSEKKEILSKIKGWLKPQGKLILVDYCCHNYSELSTDENAGFMVSIENYQKILENCGYKNVEFINMTNDLVKSLHKSLQNYDWLSTNPHSLENEEKEKIEEKIKNLSLKKVEWILITANK